ncbi:hypothetical protein JR316_0009666 [Psilocybe cubensis]|uniref:Uncharacterized protein n=2 Tax=Psilocybe cubensis TaxID=181762 RepID=A0ACB8GP02_PSICU|nr:hypothetical protein JR316_0009666 [Psilocybe cubensis]KAH9477453.1 hypothetical protein JR316_0009666 [Psilocybe cubensis]
MSNEASPGDTRAAPNFSMRLPACGITINLTNSQLEMLISRGMFNLPRANESGGGSSPATYPPILGPPFVRSNTQWREPWIESILDIFPCVSHSMILAIARHEFIPLNLYQLNSVTDPSAPRAGSLDDYPDFLSVLEPLCVYFQILGSYAATGGDANAVLSVQKAFTGYCLHLSKLSRTYQWQHVLQYHLHFFRRRSFEMLAGDFSGWLVPENELVGLYLVGRNRLRAASFKSDRTKFSPGSSSSSSSGTDPYTT